MSGRSQLFSPDYVAARRRFREAANRLGCQIQACPVGGQGPDGEALTIDVAISPGLLSDRTLVLSSGIHGVEGFVGSAVQLGLLEAWIAQPQTLPSVRCVFLHALNPFGFAWRRRANEENVDLNRNLLLDGETFRGSPPGYAGLDALLNPARPPSVWEPVALKFLLATARHGTPALKEAIASGQYDFPRGLFYGGDRPSRMSELLTTHFDTWIGDSTQVMHLDFHTGLGRRADCKLLIDYPLTEDKHHRVSEWFGSNSFETSHARGVAYSTRGSFGRWCVTRYPKVDYLYAAAEFGTFPATAVLAGLRAENQAHHWGKPGDRGTERAKARLVELFCPASQEWRSRVLRHARHLVVQAVHGLAGYQVAPHSG